MLKNERSGILKSILTATQPDTVLDLIRGLHIWDTRTEGSGRFEMSLYMEHLCGTGDAPEINVETFKRVVIDHKMSIPTMRIILKSYLDVLTEYLENDTISSMMSMDNEDLKSNAWTLFREMDDKVEFLSNHVKMSEIYEGKFNAAK